ncbi:MAG: transcriptional regulator [Bacteriovoracaceae bacterium]|nr:transcriptional regulator [Bacteriovoracaceae bacterium]
MLLFVSNYCFGVLPTGEVPPYVEITEKNGGKVVGGTWKSSEIKGKTTALFYVDPDVKDLNEHLGDALKAKKYPLDKYQSMAIINMDATWLPNFILDSSLEAKQKKYPSTIFVRDKDKILVKKWKLGDDNYDVVIFDKEGKVLFSKDGKLTDQEVKQVVALIDKDIS